LPAEKKEKINDSAEEKIRLMTVQNYLVLLMLPTEKLSYIYLIYEKEDKRCRVVASLTVDNRILLI
jgi:hypothetical protein